MLEIVGRVPTGIPRVHAFLIGHAIQDPDPSVRVILYDRQMDAYRNATDRELEFFILAQKAQPEGNGGKSRRQRELLRNAFCRVRENPRVGRDLDRNAAALIAGSQFGTGGRRYSLVKNTIRAYRFYRKALDAKNRRGASSDSKLDARRGLVLLSHAMVTGPLFSKGMLATERRAFVSHDVIPWLHPELVDDGDQGSISQLKQLLGSGAHALCISNASRAMLDRLVAEIGNPAVRIGQFPLPSVLYDKAKSLGRVSRFEPKQPFVLYCSTVEVRKNHLLLAKIWKQARDEGVSLPKLVCVGRWGWRVEELRAFLAANPQLSQSIEFLGPIDDVALIDLYRSALFGVMPSYVEGWGLGASECLDFGLPVIVSTSPALKEVVRNLMPAIDPNDQAAWFAQIRRLAEDGDERESRRKAIAAHYRPIARQASWDAIKAALRVSISQ